MAALAIVAVAISIPAVQWFGTLRRNGVKTAGHLGHIIKTRLGFADITVEPNKPKAGDVSLTGTVDSPVDADAIAALVEKWRAWPSEIHADVKIATHNKATSPDRETAPLVPRSAVPVR